MTEQELLVRLLNYRTHCNNTDQLQVAELIEDAIAEIRALRTRVDRCELEPLLGGESQ